jgi:two-component system C4-dicarboxylate transport response regulator DctD
LQVRLLRAIEERVIVRLGSNRCVPVDVRILAATKANLEQACEQGEFRKDLFYRLNVVSIHVPPLRERRDDIPLLFLHFLYAAASEYHRPVPFVEPSVMQDIMKQPWPGNVRELRNAAERYLLESTDKTSITLRRDQAVAQPSATPSLRDQVHTFERAVLDQELSRHKGDIKSVCEALGLPRKTLYDKMARHGLSRSQYT